MLFRKYKIHLLIIVLASLLIGIGQQWLAENYVSFLPVLNHFLTLMLSPAVFATFLIGIMWYLGRKINSRKIFYSYLFSWLAVIIFSTITIIKVYA